MSKGDYFQVVALSFVYTEQWPAEVLYPLTNWSYGAFIGSAKMSSG
jgi:hypothetical protein